MKQCGRCQAENFDDQKYCSLCGKELTSRIVLDVHGGQPLLQPDSETPSKPKPAQRAYEHFVKAKECIAERDLDGAVAQFQEALTLCPKDPMIERLLAKTIEAKNSVKGREQQPSRPRTGVQAAAAGRPAEVARPPENPAQRSRVNRPVRGLPMAEPRASSGPAQVVRPSSEITWPDLSTRTSSSVPARQSPPGLAHHEPVHELPGSPTRSGRGSDAPPRASTAGSKPSPHTGRFLEVYSRTPTLSPALLIDGPSEDGFREIAVSVLMLGAFLVFGFLLLL
jgi:hypothetical protein